uniref:Uncharacterized protein n=1 Tax=Trichogramma kaykai TaxID=54128 RepID=A0ABD2W1B9_9HYME
MGAKQLRLSFKFAQQLAAAARVPLGRGCALLGPMLGFERSSALALRVDTVEKLEFLNSFNTDCRGRWWKCCTMGLDVDNILYRQCNRMIACDLFDVFIHC